MERCRNVSSPPETTIVISDFSIKESRIYPVLLFNFCKSGIRKRLSCIWQLEREFQGVSVWPRNMSPLYLVVLCGWWDKRGVPKGCAEPPVATLGLLHAPQLAHIPCTSFLWCTHTPMSSAAEWGNKQGWMALKTLDNSRNESISHL